MATVIDLGQWAPNATFEDAPQIGGSKMEQAVIHSVMTGKTVRLAGSQGIGKSQTIRSAASLFPGTEVVNLNMSCLSADELLMMAASKITDPVGVVKYVLTELLHEALASPGQKILHIEDGLQAGSPAALNAVMQLLCSWEIGTFKLRDYGVIGVVASDNLSLKETALHANDIAQQDRLFTVKVTAADSQWQHALAMEFPEHNLTDVFKVWGELSGKVRSEIMSPRTMEHLIFNLTLGNPGIWGIPLHNGVRAKIGIQNGDTFQDRTGEYLDRFAAALGAPNPASVPNPVVRAAMQTIEHGKTMLVQGAPGTGKTEVIKETVANLLGVDPMENYLSMANTSVDELVIPMVVDGQLRMALRERFYSPEAKVLILDEVNRCRTSHDRAKMMELLLEHTIADQEITNLRGVIAIQNPGYACGRKLDVQHFNRAQADRFFISLDIQPEDIASNEWLLNEYPKQWAAKQVRAKVLMTGGSLSEDEAATEAAKHESHAKEAAETVIDWFKNDIDQEARDWVTGRSKERLIDNALLGFELETALIHIGEGEAAPVSLAGLRDRLAERPRTGLREIAENVDEWERLLGESANADPTHGTVEASMVHSALMAAELSQLETHREVVIRMLRHLPRKFVLTYVDTKGETQKFWVLALAEKNKRWPKKKAA